MPNETIEFAKLSGSGNDFLCIDNRAGDFDEILSSPERVGHFARTLCRRGLGIGADGVIFAVIPEVEGFADLGARVFEADGSEAELCGNGTACFIHWAFVNGYVVGPEIKVLTPAGVVLGQNGGADYVRVCIPLPEDMQTDLELTVGGETWRCDFVVTGVPHVVCNVDCVDAVDIAHWGPLLRNHPRFAPRGVNANFVEVLGEGELAIRTWEFGVEGETLACGTGSAAAAIVTAIKNRWPKEYTTGQRPVRLRARSGDVLVVYFTLADDGSVTDVCLETIVRFVCRGLVADQLAAQAMRRDVPAAL